MYVQLAGPVIVLDRTHSRIDKKMYLPTTKIDEWVMVVYEQQRRFSADVAKEVVKGLREAATAVGEPPRHLLAKYHLLTVHSYRCANCEEPSSSGVPACSGRYCHGI